MENVVRAADQLKEAMPHNSFNSVLAKVELYKSADLTPMILMDNDQGLLYVLAEETFMKKLH